LLETEDFKIQFQLWNRFFA